MGDWGRNGTKTKIVVKAGDSYAKLFGRGFGDALRHFGYKTLNPGDVLDLSGFKQKAQSDYFVSAKDVNYAQNSTNANYKGPVMQQYGDYEANYEAARKAGQAGVYGNQNFTGTGANAGAGKPVPPGGNINYSPASAPLPAPPGVTGQGAAAQWQAGQAQRSAATAQAVVNQGSALERGMAGTAKPGTPTPAGFVNSTAMPPPKMGGGLIPGSTTGAGVKAAYASGSTTNITLPQQPTAPGTSQKNAAAQPPMPTTYATPPIDKLVPSPADTLAAAQVAQGLGTIGGPSYMTQGQSKAIMDMALMDTSGKLLMKIMDIYEPGIDGALRAKGSTYAPGSQNLPNYTTNPLPGPNDSSYSNTPPQGYVSSFGYSKGGRRGGGGGSGGGGGGNTTKRPRWYENDYSLRLGQ